MKNTSKKAFIGSQEVRETHKEKILKTFKKYSHQYLDVNDLVGLTKLRSIQIHRRLSELERDYLITPVDESGTYTLYTLVTDITKKKAVEDLTVKRLKAGCKMLLSEEKELPEAFKRMLVEFNNSLKR